MMVTHVHHAHIQYGQTHGIRLNVHAIAHYMNSDPRIASWLL